ncbi:MAG: hypothetical protein Q9187_008365, partial [Circinaria calcarea]
MILLGVAVVAFAEGALVIGRDPGHLKSLPFRLHQRPYHTPLVYTAPSEIQLQAVFFAMFATSQARMVLRCVIGPRKRFLTSFSNVHCDSIRKSHSRLKHACPLTLSPSTANDYTKLRRVHTRKTNQRSTIGGTPRTIEERVNALAQDAVESVQSQKIPSEAQILASLQTCEDLARSITSSSSATAKDNVTPASNLLFLDEGAEASTTTAKHDTTLAPSLKDKVLEIISAAAENIIVNPTVFITPKVLESYVNIQAVLEKPESLGNALTLYAKKLIPRPGTSPVQYMPAKPNKASSAVPLSVANKALTVAINARNLPLCLDILKATVCTSAFQKNKLTRKAILPLSAFALAPFAIYTFASQLSVYQESMSTDMATKVAFAGISAYVCFTATIGIVAVTTANDQMDRVTWATGMPLRERWLREEERAMLDRVAGAWGFKESWRRGEEEGQDWEALREWIGLR